MLFCNFVQEQKRNLQAEMSEQKLNFLLCIYALYQVVHSCFTS
jgi:hypothetical protein